MQDNNIYIHNKNGSVFQANKEYINLANMFNAKHSELSKESDTYFKDIVAELSKKTVDNNCISDKNIITINKNHSIKKQ